MRKINNHTLIALGNLTWKETFSGWGLPLLLSTAAILILGAPLLVASKEDSSLIPSTRTQLACIFAWLIPMFWGGMRLASIGASQSLRNLTLFWRCMGVKDFGRYLFMWLPFFAISALCSSLAALVYFISYSGGPQPLYETGYAAFQFIILTVTVQAGLFFLTLGLSAVVSAPAAFFVSTGVFVYSLYGVTLLGFIRSAATDDAARAAIIDAAWAFSPQLRLGDLTPRLVFNWGAMPTSDFSQILLYCLGWLVVFGLIGYAAFRRGKSSATL